MHIKCLKTTFAEIPNMSTIPDFCKFGEVTGFSITEGSSISEIQVSLDSEKIYVLSIDQSSTCSGVFIKDIKNTEAYILEFKKTTGMTADDYIFDFEIAMNELTANKTFMFLIYEAPIKTSAFRSSQVAFQLEGTIKLWTRRYSQFRNAKLDNIEPTSWKSVIVDKNKWGSNYTSKQASKESIIELFPWTGNYRSSLNKDNDGYEAVGIMMGWFSCSFDAFGRPYVRGEEYTGTVGCIAMPSVDAKSLCEALTAQGVDANWFVYNPKVSTFKNIMKSARKYEVSLIQIEDAYSILSVCVEANIKPPDDGVLTLIVVTPENMNAAALRIIGKQFQFYL